MNEIIPIVKITILWMYPWLKKKWVIKDNSIKKRRLPNRLYSNSMCVIFLKTFWNNKPYPTTDTIIII